MLIEISGTAVALTPSLHQLTLNHALEPKLLSEAVAAEEVVFERDLAADIGRPVPPGRRASEVLAQVPALEKLWGGKSVLRDRGELDQISVGEAAQIVESSTTENFFGMYFKKGIDMQLWNAVQPTRRSWMQTSEDLQRSLSVYPEPEQLAELQYACNLSKRESDLKAELRAWESGDLAHFANVADEIYARTPLRAQSVLGDRNPVMLEAICQRIAAERRALFVIGAAHFVRSDGILAGLAQRGFTVNIVC